MIRTSKLNFFTTHSAKINSSGCNDKNIKVIVDNELPPQGDYSRSYRVILKWDGFSEAVLIIQFYATTPKPPMPVFHSNLMASHSVTTILIEKNTLTYREVWECL